MKVAIPAADQTLEAEVDSRFGRCRYFVIIDTETMNFHAIPNAGGRAGEGAGVQVAQILANEGVKAVIGDNFGPTAFITLEYAGIRVYSGKGIISQVMKQFKSGELKEIQQSNVPKKTGQFKR